MYTNTYNKNIVILDRNGKPSGELMQKANRGIATSAMLGETHTLVIFQFE